LFFLIKDLLGFADKDISDVVESVDKEYGGAPHSGGQQDDSDLGSLDMSETQSQSVDGTEPVTQAEDVPAQLEAERLRLEAKLQAAKERKKKAIADAAELGGQELQGNALEDDTELAAKDLNENPLEEEAEMAAEEIEENALEGEPELAAAEPKEKSSKGEPELAVADLNEDALDVEPLITVYERKKKALADPIVSSALIDSAVPSSPAKQVDSVVPSNPAKQVKKRVERDANLMIPLYARVLVQQLFHLQIKVLNTEVLESTQL